MSIQITFVAKQRGPSLDPAVIRYDEQFEDALVDTVLYTERELLNRGRRDISMAGNFGSRWINGLKIDTFWSGSFNAVLQLYHEIDYAHIHEFGGTIHGQPLLWIPLSHTGILVRARDYPGNLLRVDRAVGRPLLIDTRDKEPIYFGIEQVTLPPRFNLRSIAAEVVGELQDVFRRFMGAARG
jgi:hypothetical protein